MAAKNERKLEVLKFVDQEGEVTPDQVADIFDMEIHNARMRRIVKRMGKRRIT